jgi:hypothetical protein
MTRWRMATRKSRVKNQNYVFTILLKLIQFYGFLAWYKILNDWYHMYKMLGYINVPIIAYRPKDPVSIGSRCEFFTWNKAQENEQNI